MANVNDHLNFDDASIEYLQQRIRELGRRIVFDTDSTGNCQFDAIGMQLNPVRQHDDVRNEIVEYLLHDGFERYRHENTEEAHRADLEKMREIHCWGDEKTLRGAADVFNLHIIVVPSNPDWITVEIFPHMGSNEDTTRVVLAHYFELHYYGTVPHDEAVDSLSSGIYKLRINANESIMWRRMRSIHRQLVCHVLDDKLDQAEYESLMSDAISIDKDGKYTVSKHPKTVNGKKLSELCPEYKGLMKSLRLSGGKAAPYSPDAISGYIAVRFLSSTILYYDIAEATFVYIEDRNMADNDKVLDVNHSKKFKVPTQSNGEIVFKDRVIRAPEFSPKTKSFSTSQVGTIKNFWSLVGASDETLNILDLGSACGPEVAGFLLSLKARRDVHGHKLKADVTCVDRVQEWQSYLQVLECALAEQLIDVRITFEQGDLTNLSDHVTIAKKRWLIFWSFVITENSSDFVLYESAAYVFRQCEIGSVVVICDRSNTGSMSLVGCMLSHGFAVIYCDDDTHDYAMKEIVPDDIFVAPIITKYFAIVLMKLTD